MYAVQRLVDEISKWLPWSPSMGVTLLGIDYDASEDAAREAFLQDFRSRLLLTYRSGFSPPLQLVGGRVISSDTGWGCMLRVTQMMLAQSFISLVLGRSWRFEESVDWAEGSPYLRIAALFLDVPQAPFSLHRMVAAGQKLLGKEPSAWFGPTSAAQAVGHIFQELAAEAVSAEPEFVKRLACVVLEDGAIYKDEVLERFDSGCDSVLLLICRRLGLDHFNLGEYREGVESCFKLKEFQGLASGNSSSSAHFFVATHGDCLLYLDPHTTQPALQSVEDIRKAPGLRAERALPLRWPRLNPSACMAFLVRSKEEFHSLCDALVTGPRAQVFEVLERRPSYSGHLEEDAEDGEMVLLQ